MEGQWLAKDDSIEWEVKTLGELAGITMGQSPPSAFYNIAGTGLPFHQGVTDFGAILMSVRAPVGRLNISTKKRPLCHQEQAEQSSHTVPATQRAFPGRGHDG
jgi:hypothetical protein